MPYSTDTNIDEQQGFLKKILNNLSSLIAVLDSQIPIEKRQDIEYILDFLKTENQIENIIELINNQDYRSSQQLKDALEKLSDTLAQQIYSLPNQGIIATYCEQIRSILASSKIDLLEQENKKILKTISSLKTFEQYNNIVTEIKSATKTYESLNESLAKQQNEVETELQNIAKIKSHHEMEHISSKFNSYIVKYQWRNFGWFILSSIFIALATIVITINPHHFINKNLDNSSITQNDSLNDYTLKTIITTNEKLQSDNNHSTQQILEKNHHQIRVFFEDIAPFWSKFIIVFIFLTAGIICARIFLKNRRIIQEYTHRELVGSNMMNTLTILRGLPDNEKLSSEEIKELIIIPSLKLIIDNPLQKIYDEEKVSDISFDKEKFFPQITDMLQNLKRLFESKQS